MPALFMTSEQATITEEGEDMAANGGIDPVKFGALVEQVDQLERQVTSLQHDVKELLALANKSKGGFWVGMTVAAGVGAIVSWIAEKLVGVHIQ